MILDIIVYRSALLGVRRKREKNGKTKQRQLKKNRDNYMTQTKRDNSTNALPLFEIVIEFHTSKQTNKHTPTVQSSTKKGRKGKQSLIYSGSKSAYITYITATRQDKNNGRRRRRR